MKQNIEKLKWKNILSTAICILLLAALLAIAGYSLFANLGELWMVDYDEARHGVNAYEMIRNDDYLVHTYQGEPDLWNLKPPISFWSIALAYRLFGYQPFALRFFSALATLLSMMALTGFAWRRLGRAPALMLLAVFACNAGLYGNHFARFGDADSQYQLFFTLSMICMMNGRGRFRWYYGGALCFALAFLTKAVHAATIPLIYLAFFTLTRQWRTLSWKRAGLLAVWGLGPILLWAAARYARDGMTFFQSMLQTDVVQRVTSQAVAAEKADSGLMYYIYSVIGYPAMKAGLHLSAVCGVYCAICRIRPDRAEKDIIVCSLLWLLIPTVVYAASGTQFCWYVYSGFMAIPCLAGAMLSMALRGKGWKRLPIQLCAVAAAVALGFYGWQNMSYVSGITFSHVYQECLRANLDRDDDSGMRMFIQYYDAKSEAVITKWQQGDMLAALLYGDVVCEDGGAEAFLECGEPALIIIGRDGNGQWVDELAGQCIPRNEEGYIYMYEN